MSILKWIGIGAAGLAGTAAAGVAALAYLVDWNDLRGFIGRQASSALGREVAIGGNLDVQLGDPIRIHAEKVRVANAQWSDDPTMAEIQVLDAALRLWPLLRGNIDMPELRLGGPDVILETNNEGQPNWNFGDSEAPTPENRGDLPVIGQLAVEQGLLRYRDPVRNVDVTSELRTLNGQGGGGQDLKLTGDGAFIGKPMTLELNGGSLESVREGSDPWPIRLKSAIGDTQATVEGTVTDPVQLTGVDLTFSVMGPDLSEVAGELGLPVPRTPNYALGGHLGHEGTAWTLRDMNGRLGDSDLSGELAFDTGGERPMLRGRLKSNRLDPDDFTGLTGAAPEGEEDYAKKTPNRVLPDQPIDLAALRNTDMDVEFTGAQVAAPYVPLSDLKLRARLDAGRLTVEPLSLGVAGGEIAGKMMLDGSQDVPSVGTDLNMRRIQMAQLFRETPFAKEMGGTIGGKVELSGQGNTTANILGNSDGRLTFAVAGGRVSALITTALQTDVLETLGIALSGDQPVRFNCIVGNFKVDRGMVHAETLVFDNPDTVIWGEGGANLRQENLDLTIQGRPKELSVFATHLPVHIQGKFANPEISVDATETAARGAAAVLGGLVNPLIAILPFIEPGSGEDAPCAQLVQDAQKPNKGKSG
jgi:uncharacterized protein involved in outer membrane biogenesis